MTRREVFRKLAGLEDRNQALTLCRMVSNLFCLFDNRPPERILIHLQDLFRTLDGGGNGSQIRSV